MKGSVMKRAMRLPMRLGNKLINPALHRFECGVLGGGGGTLRHPPVFILGAPRCGSTLLYQLLLDRFDFGYISNLHCMFFGAPSLAERAFRPSRWRGRSTFKSDHGLVQGWSSPSECGDYWYRFFRRSPQYASLANVESASIRNLRRSMKAIGDAMRRPVLFKNLLSALRMEPILEALPESTFIVVQRSLLDTAHSILEARMNLYGDYEKWFSVEPPNIESLKSLPVHEQVVEQIRGIHALIERSRGHLPAGFLDVDYELLCHDTRAVLGRIAVFLKDRGVALVERDQVPPSFNIKRNVRIDETLFNDLKRYIDTVTGRGH